MLLDELLLLFLERLLLVFEKLKKSFFLFWKIFISFILFFSLIILEEKLFFNNFFLFGVLVNEILSIVFVVFCFWLRESVFIICVNVFKIGSIVLLFVVFFEDVVKLLFVVVNFFIICCWKCRSFFLCVKFFNLIFEFLNFNFDFENKIFLDNGNEFLLKLCLLKWLELFLFIVWFRKLFLFKIMVFVFDLGVLGILLTFLIVFIFWGVIDNLFKIILFFFFIR